MDTKPKKGKKAPPAVPDPVPVITPRFAVDDPAGYQYLEDNGFVVFKDVATREEVDIGRDLIWDHLQMVCPGITRNDPTTYEKWPDPFGKGIVTGDGVGHSKFMWFARSLPAVKTIYATIWGTQELMSSFDGCCVWRPHEYNDAWKTTGGWFHLDQNGNQKPNKICVQGFLNFYPAGLEDGGLCVIPKSHLVFQEIFKTLFPSKEGDFVQLQHCANFWSGIYKQHRLTNLKVCCEPGDFVLWDSRIIHCSTPPTSKRPLPLVGSNTLSLRRLVAYICMTPLSRLTPEVEAARINAYYNGETTSHWPEECLTPAQRKNSKRTGYVPPTLSKESLALIPLSP